MIPNEFFDLLRGLFAWWSADWAAVFIALIALVFTAWQARLARDQSRIATLPILRTSANIVPGGAERFNLLLKNVGAGPAKVFKAQLFVDGREVEQQIKQWQRAFADLNYHPTHAAFGFPEPDLILEAGGTIELAGCPSLDEHAESFKRALGRVRIVLHYSSFFGENFSETFDGSKVSDLA